MKISSLFLKSLFTCSLSLFVWESAIAPTHGQTEPESQVECELLVVGGGLAGAAASYEALLRGKTVCLTEITDWVGGQISSQGTSALDERTTQRSRLFFPQGYLEFRDRIEDFYGELNPGDCWVSYSCFLPKDAHEILAEQLQDAAKEGKGTLHWFPSTVIKELATAKVGEETHITSAIAIQHTPQENAPPLNTEPLSQTIEDAYRYEDSEHLQKKIIRFVPPNNSDDWYVIEATETGEIIALADVPYRLGIDPRSHLEPSSSSAEGDPYCTQGFTYTFAMEATEEPQQHPEPEFYSQHAPYYSYELERLADFNLVFTYRRIWSPEAGEEETFRGVNFTAPTPGDISMQNWTWGNDYRPGTAQDNLVYTRQQLQATGQLDPGGWLGGLRTEALQKGEDHALGYFHWLVAGDTDSQLGEGFKKPDPNHRLLTGIDSPMGTVHGLSKYPYMREGRRIIGRPSPGYRDGFTVAEIDISRHDYQDEYYKETLSENSYRQLWQNLKGLELITNKNADLEQVQRRSRSTIYPDSVGIGHYAIDFHPCMNEYPAEKAGNTEREGERRGAGQAYPFQIPLRAMIPQKIDNLLVTGKTIATSHIAAAAYRVHSFEWSSGAAAGITAAFALENDIFPYQLTDESFIKETQLRSLQKILNESGNPTAFPDTSIFNESWEDWK
ncbi:glycerol-3-phosphate dehydrogenase [Xenococcus sp. PCC 7305]|uniref:FAD-dependent oxidoreductase n=1 Tax=Xenococcus sp. PCC 7305 TaxID=102125 RepID=UPI0002ACD2A6|nr:FAD-dependent oxidoreductase [Xenococcus sp. PCC 7305]ELS05552.1 glycerol-3-phosphate dehydrogenase [Xenococcus sp. PCC 7305]